MTAPLDGPTARALALAAAADWGMSTSDGLTGTRLLRGWRFRVAGAGLRRQVGDCDIVVGHDRTVLRVPTGASDGVVARLLDG